MKRGFSTAWLRLCLLFLGLSSAIILVGCGSGQPEPTWNIAGNWFMYHDTSGISGEQGPDTFTFAQSTNDLSGTTPQGDTITGSISGTDVSFSWTAASDGTSYSYNGTASAGNMAGTWSASNGQTGTWHSLINLSPTVSNLAGSWNIFNTPSGSTEQGPDVFTLLQSGNDISGTGPDGETVTGNIGSLYVILTWTTGDGTTYIYSGIVNSDGSSISGTWTSPGGQSGTWRATKSN